MSGRARIVGVIAAAIVLGATPFAQQQTPPRDTVAAGPTGSGSIAGLVRAEGAAGEPLPYAQVGILGIDNGIIRLSSADASGRFRLANLPAGKYLVAAIKPPYIGMVYGATQVGRAGTAIVLATGETREDLVIPLTRGAVVSGVITDEHGRPAVGLAVTLQSGAGGSPQQQMMTLAFTPAQVTDDRGAFRFSGLLPGEYVLTATRTDRRDPDARVPTGDEIDAALREVKTGGAAAPVATATAPRSTIVDPQGEGRPFPNAMSMNPMMGGLMAAMSGGIGDQQGAYAPVFYPGTVHRPEARAIVVAAGEERTGVDFTAPAIATGRITGIVLGPDGQPIQNVSLQLRGTDRTENLVSMLSAMMNADRVGSDGKFSLNSVPPGRYVLEARTMSMQAGLMAMMPGMQGGSSRQPQLFASVDVVVEPGQTMSGIELRLRAGTRVTGTVVFNATRLEKPKDASQVMVALVPASSNDAMFGVMGGITGRANADGSFAVDGVLPGRYVVQATSMDPATLLQWLPQSVTVGGRSVSDAPIEVTADGLTDVRIALSDQQQELAGSLQDAAGRPASQFTILLFSTQRAHWLPNSRRVLLTRPATDGSFAFAGPLGPPPGEYFLAALTDLAPEDQYKPEVLGEIAAAALKVTIGAGEKKRQDIRIAR